MKNLLFLLVLIPFVSFGQVNKKTTTLSNGVQDSVLGTSIILKDNAVVFQKVYTTELTKSELIARLQSFLPTAKGFQLTGSPNQQAEQFSGRMTDYIVNFRKYGGTLLGTNVVLNYPMTANVIVQVKDNRYRVIISNMIFRNIQSVMLNAQYDVLLDEGATKKKRTVINDNASMLKALGYIDKDFSDSFDINSASVKTETNF